MAETESNGHAVAEKKLSAPALKKFNTYLTIGEAKCQDAIDWYKKVFGFQDTVKMHFPKRKAEQDAPLIMHAELKLGDMELMLADEVDDDVQLMGAVKSPAKLKGTSVTLMFECDGIDDLYAKAIDNGATVSKELADQFWGARYGKFVDPFGYEWALHCQISKAPEGGEEGKEKGEEEKEEKA